MHLVFRTLNIISPDEVKTVKTFIFMIIADQTIVMIFRLVICTIVRTEEKLNVVSKMKCVKQIGLQSMTR